jgi:DNA-directed RNA polymerase specialized sigma24 family protein
MCAATTGLTDRQLFFNAVKGSRTAYRRLISRYAPLVTAEICAILPCHSLYVKDLSRAVFREAYRHLPRLRRPVRFRRWLLALTRRVCSIVLARHKQVAGREGLKGVVGGCLDKLVGVSSLLDKAFLLAVYASGKYPQTAVARFGRIDRARRIPARPYLIGPLSGAGEKLVHLPVRFRRIFYYHLVAGKSLAEIGRLLRISPGAASTRMFRCFRVLGSVPRDVGADSLASLRSLVLLPAAALEEESVIDSQFDRVQYLGENFSDVLRRLRVSLLRYRKEAQLLRLSTRDNEKLSSELPRMFLSPKTSYKWNTKVAPRKRRLVPVAVSAVVHTVILAILTLAIVRVRSAGEGPPRINVNFRPARQEQQLIELEQKQIEITWAKPLQLDRDEREAAKPEALTREEAAMAMLLETLEKKPPDIPGELIAAEDEGMHIPADELIEKLLGRFRESEPFTEKKGSPSPAESASGGKSEASADRGAAGLRREVDEEWLERTRRWRKEAHKKLKKKIQRVTVLTQCFAAIKDIAYEKSSAFFSLENARSYVSGRFLDDIAQKVADKCGVSKEKVLDIWGSRKTTHPKTVHLGISGTRIVQGGVVDWVRTHPIIKKRVIEYLIASSHCEITKVYKEPCWRCAGKGYLLQTTMRPQSPGFTFYRVPCPICNGLAYELVIVYE